MMRTLSYILAIIICSFLSCKKDDHSEYRDTLVVGDNTDMIVTRYDTILVGWYHHDIYIDLDINFDHISDVRLTSEIWGSVGLGPHPRAQIACLNSNCFLLGVSATDTCFLYRHTTTVKGDNGKVDIYKYLTYACNRNHIEDSIVSISTSVFKIKSLTEKDTLSTRDDFKSDTLILISDGYSYPPFRTFLHDTTINVIQTFVNDCNTFPLDEFNYIGLKIIDSGYEKLGWIKLSISDKYKITLLESAIQK